MPDIDAVYRRSETHADADARLMHGEVAAQTQQARE